MGLFDKFKDLFTEPDEDEEEVVEEEEVKVEQIKKEPPRRPEKNLERRREKTVAKEEVVKEESKEEEPVKEEKPTREETKASVFFTENDFADLEPEKPKRVEKHAEAEVKAPKKEEKKSAYGGHYSGTYTSPSLLTQEKPSFKPTPIISPIYGILDKNYSKDDIVERKDTKTASAVDGMTHDRLDEVRTKAYGTLENELEETIYDESRTRVARNSKPVTDEVDLFDELESEQRPATKKTISLEDTAELAKTVTEQEKNIRELEEITMDLTKELDNLLLKKESFNAKKEKVARKQQEVDESDAPLTENELFNLIDSMYEEGKDE